MPLVGEKTGVQVSEVHCPDILSSWQMAESTQHLSNQGHNHGTNLFTQLGVVDLLQPVAATVSQSATASGLAFCGFLSCQNWNSVYKMLKVVGHVGRGSAGLHASFSSCLVPRTSCQWGSTVGRKPWPLGWQLDGSVFPYLLCSITKKLLALWASIPVREQEKKGEEKRREQKVERRHQNELQPDLRL